MLQILLLLFVMGFAKDIPVLPEEFKATVTMKVMGFEINGPYWRSYANQVDKIEAWGATTIQYYNCKLQYMAEQCTSKDYEQEMYPMQIAPIISTFIGEEVVNGIMCDHWQTLLEVPMESAKFDYYITNTTGVGMYVPVKVVMQVSQGGGTPFTSEMSFKDLKPQTFNVKDTFIVPESQCPQAPQDITTCSHNIFPPVTAKTAVFVLDVSGSMSTQQQTKEGQMSRLDVLKMEMKKIVGGLTEKQNFNVISFSDSYTDWKPEPVPASDTFKQDGNQFVDGLVANGGTHMYDALRHALNQTSVGSIFFLTDGEPSAYTTQQIIDMVKRVEAQLPFNVKIHATNFFGSNPGFMQELAQVTGGVFTNIKDGQV